MAGFSMIGLGMLLGMAGGAIASKLKKKAPQPGAADAQTTPPAEDATLKPPNSQEDASKSAAAAQQAGVKARKRVAGGSSGAPRARKPLAGMGGAGISKPQVEPRTLIGY